eukprot:TRINITY_DN14431_c0_g1_i1.p1 TRINITY_DN14431_c0_g1~~TRINITY_DN14431_c0_g1_i1.p1  ORF type:complete len:651 (+),score=89.62 TRINITY_DN14431_c0_g1_i1:53-2005(+)
MAALVDQVDALSERLQTEMNSHLRESLTRWRAELLKIMEASPGSLDKALVQPGAIPADAVPGVESTHAELKKNETTTFEAMRAKPSLGSTASVKSRHGSLFWKTNGRFVQQSTSSAVPWTPFAPEHASQQPIGRLTEESEFSATVVPSIKPEKTTTFGSRDTSFGMRSIKSVRRAFMSSASAIADHRGYNGRRSDLPRGLEDLERDHRKVALKFAVEWNRQKTIMRAIEEDAVDHDWRSKVRQVVQLSHFNYLAFLAIVTNVVVIGVETNILATSDAHSSPYVFFVLDVIYTILFTVELAMRMVAEGKDFLTVGTWSWNLLDVAIVVSSITGVFLEVSENEGQLKMIRSLRITRLVRIARLFRVARFLRALKKLIHSISATVKSVAWAFVLILIIVYGFAVAFTQAVAEYHLDNGIPKCSSSNACDLNDLTMFWGSLERSMFTLFKCISNGLDWHDAVQTLGVVGPFWLLLFLFYIAFMTFAVLNVLTGLFCQSAIESTQSDKELAAMQMMAHRDKLVDFMTQLFKEIDDEHSGLLTLTELQCAMECDEVKAYFASVDIDTGDSWTLFELLDTDNSGKISVDEFVNGCLNLRGQAKAVHMMKIMHDIAIDRQAMTEFFHIVTSRLDDLAVASLDKAGSASSMLGAVSSVQ